MASAVRSSYRLFFPFLADRAQSARALKARVNRPVSRPCPLLLVKWQRQPPDYELPFLVNR